MAAWDKDLLPDKGRAWDKDIIAADDIPKMAPRQRAIAASKAPNSTINGADILGGMAAGAGAIGSTLLAPIDIAEDLFSGKGLTLESNRKRRADIQSALQELGANPESKAYGAGKIGAEILGTLGVGPAMATGAKAIGAAPGVVRAMQTNGMSTGATPVTNGGKVLDMGVRMGAGSAAGAGSAFLVNPEETKSGAIAGAVTPPVIAGLSAVGQGIGAAARGTRNGIGELFKTEQQRGAQELIAALDLTPAQLPGVIAQLRGAAQYVPGAAPTVAQALDKPQASILQRVVSAGPGGEKLREALAAQAEARLQALGNVAPVSPNGLDQVRSDFGRSIERQVIPDEAAISQRITGMYNNIDPGSAARIPAPVAAFEAAQEKFTGAGAFGKNPAAGQATATARGLSGQIPGTPAGAIIGPNGAPLIPAGAPQNREALWPEVNRLRSSLNEQWSKAVEAGDNQVAAALAQQKAALDDAIKSNLPAKDLAQFLEANSSHAAKMERFHTGPQAGIFQQRNGLPSRQGGEIPGLFWGQRPGTAEDVNHFKRLVDNDPSMIAQLQSMITSEGAGKQGANSELGKRFTDWFSANQSGLREAFNASQFNALQNIAHDVTRATNAAVLAKGVGSDTYQKASNALDAGLFGLPAVKALTQRGPLRSVLEPARATLADSSSKGKAQRLADLLADSSVAADAMGQQVPQAQALRNLLGQGMNQINLPRGTLSGMSLADLYRAGLYRAPAVSAAQ